MTGHHNKSPCEQLDESRVRLCNALKMAWDDLRPLRRHPRQSAMQCVHRHIDQAAHQVAKNPLASVSAAFAAGFVGGLVLFGSPPKERRTERTIVYRCVPDEQ